jgi:uncharacterized protein YciI
MGCGELQSIAAPAAKLNRQAASRELLMFLVLLTYTKPLEIVDTLIPAHREYLARNYEAGVFLLSGRKEPRDGGVILASASSAQALQEVLAEDPFHIHGVATYQLVQFTPTMAAPVFRALVAA